jgi:nitroreductase
MQLENPRIAGHAIDQLFLDRWSPRSFTDEQIPQEELLRLFEAARWAPSCANEQPWRFLYAHRGSEHWAIFLGLLTKTNQSWAKHAAVLAIVVSKKTRTQSSGEEVASHSHSFDAGAAWANLSLQAQRSGWATHGMAGFDIPRASLELSIPDGFRVEAAIAIGRRGEASKLSKSFREREHPNGRNPVESFAFEGSFPSPSPA